MKTKIISFSLLLFLIAFPTKAQEWEFVGLDSVVIFYLDVSGDTIYAGGLDMYNNPNLNYDLYYSFTAGKDWIQLDSLLGDGAILSIERSNNNTIYIIKCPCQAPLAGLLYKTTDNGKSWKLINNISNNGIKWIGISPFNSNELYVIDVIYYPTGSINSLYKSTDEGNTWEDISSFPVSSHGSRLILGFDLIDSMSLYVTVDTQFDRYLYKSTDKGNSWFFVSTPPVSGTEIYTDYFVPNRLYLLPLPYISNNGGLNWFEADSGFNSNSYVYSFYQDKETTKLLYDLRTDALYSSKRENIFWTKVEGTEYLSLDFPTQINKLKNVIIDKISQKIYLGTADGIYRKEVLTNISDENLFMIKEYILGQNYPNPFNPSTTIEYQININSFVSLKVYDLLGNEIITLVNERKEPGNYSVAFNAAYLPSGIYVYRLTADNYVATKKLILLK